MSVLLLEKRGVDYYGNDIGKDDIGNYRVVGKFIGEDGKEVFTEFSEDRRNEGLHVSAQYDHEDGATWRWHWHDEEKMCEADPQYLYSKAEILRFVNDHSAKHYDKIDIKDRVDEYHN